jgi:quercetin dioxygenase-like cupin family protein
MAQPGDRIREPSGVELIFVETAEQTGGKLVIEWTLPPGRRLVARAHRHPDGPEGWAVLSGDARHEIAGVEHEATAGDSWEVPGNTSHVHPWNAGSGPLTVRQTIDAPEVDGLALGVERYFETLMALAQRGQTDEKFDIRSPLQSALTIRELLMPGSYLVGIPTWIQDAIFAPAAALARARGLKAHIEPAREQRLEPRR